MLKTRPEPLTSDAPDEAWKLELSGLLGASATVPNGPSQIIKMHS